MINDRTLAIADKLSNSEDDTLFKLLVPGESGEEKTEFEDVDKEEVSVVDKLGTDTLFGFEQIVLDDDVPGVVPLAVEASADPGFAWLSVPRPGTPLLFVPSQATHTDFLCQQRLCPVNFVSFLP